VRCIFYQIGAADIVPDTIPTVLLQGMDRFFIRVNSTMCTGWEKAEKKKRKL